MSEAGRGAHDATGLTRGHSLPGARRTGLAGCPDAGDDAVRQIRLWLETHGGPTDRDTPRRRRPTRRTVAAGAQEDHSPVMRWAGARGALLRRRAAGDPAVHRDRWRAVPNRVQLPRRLDRASVCRPEDSASSAVERHGDARGSGRQSMDAQDCRPTVFPADPAGTAARTSRTARIETTRSEPRIVSTVTSDLEGGGEMPTSAKNRRPFGGNFATACVAKHTKAITAMRRTAAGRKRRARDWTEGITTTRTRTTPNVAVLPGRRAGSSPT